MVFIFPGEEILECVCEDSFFEVHAFTIRTINNSWMSFIFFMMGSRKFTFMIVIIFNENLISLFIRSPI
jgi:hypothetical protein